MLRFCIKFRCIMLTDAEKLIKEILHRHNAKMVEGYNKYTHNLSPLQPGDTVAIQIPTITVGTLREKIITVLRHCQYWIRVDESGRITLRNHRFLWKCKTKAAPTPIPVSITSTSNTPLLHPDHPISSANEIHTAIEPPQISYLYIWDAELPHKVEKS